jgi:hypothetical protein
MDIENGVIMIEALTMLGYTFIVLVVLAFITIWVGDNLE